MKRRLEEHQDTSSAGLFFQQQPLQRNRVVVGGGGGGKEAAAASEVYRLPASSSALGPLIKDSGAHLSVHTYSEAVRSESMQSSIQYPMQSYQMTPALSQGGAGSGPSSNPAIAPPPTAASLSAAAAVNLHHAHGAQTLHQVSALAASSMHAAGQPQQQQQQQQFQRLKVEDALTYLDQVKFKFGNQPQVYNDFLDIMKEFKAQSIDTPGVIARVSHLFRGHPELIVGFNTFLPPGYKIEVQANDQVNVCVPGSTTATILHPIPPPMANAHSQQQQQASSATTNTTSTVCITTATTTTTATAAATAPVSSSVKLSHQVSPSPAATLSQPSSPQAQHAYHLNSPIHSPGGGGGGGCGGVGPPPQLPVPGGGPPAQQASQPVEFNHAINYVNKIKNRFQGQPDIYKQFLEILHTYQKEQRNLKEGVNTGTKPLTEAEVYQQVAKLFQNQEDLLQEFGQFLPDANGAASSFGDVWSSLKVKKMPTSKAINNDHVATIKKPNLTKPNSNISSGSAPGGNNSINSQVKQQALLVKRPMSSPTVSSIPSHLPNKVLSSNSHSVSQSKVIQQPLKRSSGLLDCPLPYKKPKPGTLKDVTLAEAGKFGTLNEYAFFDKVRKAFRSSEVYDNFLRCLVLFNQEVVSRSELVQLVTPFLGKFPELFKWLKDFLGYNELGPCVEPVPQRVANQERVTGDLAMEIDYTTCKRLGASYCALPKTYMQPKCSGRTTLCKEVLNDTWVSFPSWSEDSTFVSSRKTQYEEYIYRCEDERFELDVVLETNLATIRVLEGVQKKVSRMPPEEASKYRLDDNLGGTSQVIHQRTVRRIYGDKAADIIDGLKRNPVVAVPLVLRRLKAKEEEWRDAQKNFNKVWRDQNEKYYLKSLDHQGINFKQMDVKALRSKSLLNEIETLYDERHEQAEEGSGDVTVGPHMTFSYKDKSILDDAANLIIHHVKRQTGIHKEDKGKIKELIRQFVPDLFFHPRQDLSDDEKEDDDDMEDNVISSAPNCEGASGGAVMTSSKFPEGSLTVDTKKENEKVDEAEVKNQKPGGNMTELVNVQNGGGNGNPAVSNPDIESLQKEKDPPGNPNDAYTLFFVNNNWYLFFRLHQILCERLTRIYEKAVLFAADEAKERKDRRESTAVALRLKPKNEIEVEEYYLAFMDMVKNLLDGNMESNAYEDTLREMFGIHAYIAFTLDKVVQNLVRQLQHIVCDESCIQCTDVYLEERRNSLAASSSPRASVVDAAYQKRAELLLSDENCFKVIIHKPECKMTIELLDTETDVSEDPVEVEKWSEYVEKYVSVGDTVSDELKEQLSKKPIFLPRNIRKWRQRAKKQHEQSNDEGRSCGVESDEVDKSVAGASSFNDGNGQKPVEGSKDGDKTDEPMEHDGGDNTDEKPACVSFATARSNAPPGIVSERKDDVNEDMEVIDDTQCKFNLNSFKMVFVVNSESYLYKRMALKRAKQCHKKISTKLNTRFGAWHLRWAESNVASGQHSACSEWLMGRGDGLVPNTTRRRNDNDLDRPPYHVYNRYRVVDNAERSEKPS